MNQRKYEKLKEEAKNKYNKTVADALKDYKEIIAAIEKVWRLLKQPKGDASLSASGRRVKRGELAAAIREAIDAAHQTFTAPEVAEWLKTHNPDLTEKTARSSVSSYLRRLAEEGKIVVIEKGAGKRPTKYKNEVDGQVSRLQGAPTEDAETASGRS